METTQQFLDRVNSALSELVGLKVRKSDNYHTKKQLIMQPFIPDRLQYSTWAITDKNYNDIFKIDFEIARNARVKYGMAGKIIKTNLIAAYPEIDTSLPLNKYLLSIDKILIVARIEKQKEDIESLKRAVVASNEHLNQLTDNLKSIELLLSPQTQQVINNKT